MNIEQLEQDGVTILVLNGRLETSTVPILDQAFASAFSTGARRFVWDCAALSYISSSGLRSFLQALKQLGASQGKLALAGPGHMIVEVFEISGFKSMLTILPDRPSAVSAIK